MQLSTIIMSITINIAIMPAAIARYRPAIFRQVCVRVTLTILKDLESTLLVGGLEHFLFSRILGC